jgi:small-conductance mechanosensitive channel
MTTTPDTSTLDRVYGLLLAPVSRLWQEIVARAPTLASALGLLFVLWLVAKVARAATIRVLTVTRLDAVTKDTFLGRILAGLSQGLTPSRAVGGLVYAAILLLALSAAADLLGLSAVRAALAAVLGYLPRLASGLCALALGGYVAGAARRAIGGVLKEIKSPYASLAETATESVILLVTVTVTANVLGADLSFVTQNIMLVLGVLVVTGAFLFASSMRRPAEEIIANYYLRRLVRVGDRIRLNDVEGTVEQFAALGLVLRDEVGIEHFVPARNLLSGLTRTEPARSARSKK